MAGGIIKTLGKLSLRVQSLKTVLLLIAAEVAVLVSQMSQTALVASNILDHTCLARGEKVKITLSVGEGRSTYKNSETESISDSVLAIDPHLGP